MDNFIIIAILVVIVGLAATYVYKAKKSGKKCIGCPYAGSCAKREQEKVGCSCGYNSEK